MARPFKSRRVCALPTIAAFSPCNKTPLESVELGVDEYEVVRLIDLLDLTQNECSLQMNVARTTVQAIYDSARRKIADALINGKTLLIQGGNYDLCSDAPNCCGKNCRERRCEMKQANEYCYCCDTSSCQKWVQKHSIK